MLLECVITLCLNRIGGVRETNEHYHQQQQEKCHSINFEKVSIRCNEGREHKILIRHRILNHER